MPLPVLVSPPAPVTVPLWVSVVLAAVSSVPPLAVRKVVRAVLILAVVRSVPPSKASAPLAAPRLASLDTCSTPPPMPVPPE